MSINKKIKNATPTTYNGIKFRSKLEAEVAKIFDAEGVEFQYEPFKVDLVPTFKYLGETIRSWTYTPDFVIFNNIIIEVKGYANDAWPLKKKMILKHIVDEGYKFEFYEVRSKTQAIKLVRQLKGSTDAKTAN